MVLVEITGRLEESPAMTLHITNCSAWATLYSKIRLVVVNCGLRLA